MNHEFQFNTKQFTYCLVTPIHYPKILDEDKDYNNNSYYSVYVSISTLFKVKQILAYYVYLIVSMIHVYLTMLKY